MTKKVRWIRRWPEFDDVFGWLWWSGTRSKWCDASTSFLLFVYEFFAKLKLKLWMMFWLCFWNSASLASLTRETGPKLVKGDPARKSDTQVTHVHHHVTPTIAVSDSALKFTHVLYNLSPAGTSCSEPS